jgi:hypothetical protein
MKSLMLLLAGAFCAFSCLTAEGSAQSTTLTFDDPENLGVTVEGRLVWNRVGGGHFFCDDASGDGYIHFGGPVTVHSFQMNAMPWLAYAGGGDVGSVDIGAYDANGLLAWSGTADLSSSLAWNQWLTVAVEADNITTLKFLAPAGAPHFNVFWPSIDNLAITQVPEPTILSLLGVGTAAWILRRRKGDYFRGELGVTNTANPVWLTITNLAVLNNGSNPDLVTNTIGKTFVTKTPAAFY